MSVFDLVSPMIA